VRDLDVGAPPAGSVTLDWDGRDESGRPVAPGVYLIRALDRPESAPIKVVRIL
jgi:flagellar hook assembly protein FlgD